MARQLQPPPPPRCAAWAPRAARGAHAEESLDACGKKEMLLWGSALRLTAPRITRARRLSRRPSEPRSTSRGAARGAAVCAAWRCFCRTTHPLPVLLTRVALCALHGRLLQHRRGGPATYRELPAYPSPPPAAAQGARGAPLRGGVSQCRCSLLLTGGVSRCLAAARCCSLRRRLPGGRGVLGARHGVGVRRGQSLTVALCRAPGPRLWLAYGSPELLRGPACRWRACACLVPCCANCCARPEVAPRGLI